MFESVFETVFETVLETVLETLLETLLETNKTSSINFLLAPVAVGWCARERLLSILTEIASGNHPRAAMRAVARTLHSYVAISREYGFAGANLMSLLDLCGFDDIKLVEFGVIAPTWKQRLAQWMRWPLLKQNQIRHRLFGVNHGGKFGAELIVTAKRGDWPACFDRRYK